jgi:hypothetical protein
LVAVGATLAVGIALIPLAVAQEGSGRRNLFTDIAIVRRGADVVFGYIASAEPGFTAGNPSVRHLRDAAVLAGLILGAIALALLVRRGTRRERDAALIVGGVGGASLLVPFVLAYGGIDFFHPRNLIGSLVPLLVAAGIGFGCKRAGRLGPASAGATVLVFVAVLVGVYQSSQMQRPDWRAAATAIGPPSEPRVLVVARNGQAPIAYYRDASLFRPRLGAQRVSEIDLLSVSPAVTPPGGAFRLVERRRMAPCCTLRRYRSRQPSLIHPQKLARLRILHEPSKVLIDGIP